MLMLGFKPRFSAKAASGLNCPQVNFKVVSEFFCYASCTVDLKGKVNEMSLNRCFRKLELGHCQALTRSVAHIRDVRKGSVADQKLKARSRAFICLSFEAG